MSDRHLLDGLGPVLVLSPHLDDAMFSAFEIIRRTDAEVWTVFAGAPSDDSCTEWDRGCGAASSRELVRRRRAEDLAAFDGLRSTVRHLEGFDRAYTNPRRRAADLAGLTAELEQWAACHEDGCIAFPGGAGIFVHPSLIDRVRGRGRTRISPRVPAASTDALASQTDDASGLPRLAAATDRVRHVKHVVEQRRRNRVLSGRTPTNPDHEAVRDVALHVLRSHDATTGLMYEEVPYSWSAGCDDFAGIAAAFLNRSCQKSVVTIDRKQKAGRVACYASQLTVMDPVEHRLSQWQTLPQTETFWYYAAPTVGSQIQTDVRHDVQ